MSITFHGHDGVRTYQAIALKSGLKLYMKCKMKPNRDWTPGAMLRLAGEITGNTYRRGQYRQAISDLEKWIDANGTMGN